MKIQFCKAMAVAAICQLAACSGRSFRSKWTREQAPVSFIARFETSKGDFEIEVERKFSPKAVDRLYQLLRHHYYDRAVFYRVVPKFVVQFGNSDTTKMNDWGKFKISDEPVLKSNQKGIISFARAGKESRGTELFINLEDNLRLDTLSYSGVSGFPGFGTVTKGMEVVSSLYSGYGDNIMDKLDSFYLDRHQFLLSFARLDSIKRAYVLTTKKN